MFELIVADAKRFPVRKIVFASSQAVCGRAGMCARVAQTLARLYMPGRRFGVLPHGRTVATRRELRMV